MAHRLPAAAAESAQSRPCLASLRSSLARAFFSSFVLAFTTDQGRTPVTVELFLLTFLEPTGAYKRRAFTNPILVADGLNGLSGL